MGKTFIQIIRKNIFEHVSLFLIFMAFGCSQECLNVDGVDDKTEKNKQLTTLQQVVDNVNAGEEIDLAEYENLTDYNAVINKQLTIKNGSLSNAKLLVDSENVKLDKVKKVSVTTLSGSSLTIIDSKLDDLLLLGRSDSNSDSSRSSNLHFLVKESSVTMSGTSTVENVTMNFCKAKLKISGESVAKTVNVLDDATVSGKIEKLVVDELNTAVTLENADVANVIMNGFNSQLAVLDTTTVLKNVSINTECKILCNVAIEGESQMEFTSDGQLTVVDMTEKPQLVSLSVLSKPTNIFSDNDEIDFTGLKVGGLYENVSSKVYTGVGEEENKEAFMKLETDYDVEVISDENGIITVRVSKDGKECIFEMLDSEKIAKYTVKHCQENIENEKYEIIVIDDNETKTGKVGELTNAEAKTYEGYTVEPIEQVEIKADGSTIVYVKYKRKTVTLTLNLDGGEIGGKSEMTISGKYGAKVPEVKSPTKDGYEFAGWNPQLPETFPAESTTYMAKWAGEGDYIIKYELNGGTNADSNPASYNEETLPITLADATKEDYIFGGWYKDEAYTEENKVTEILEVSTGNITLYAKWIARTLEHKFKDGYSNQNNANASGVSYNTDKGYGVVTVHSPESSGSVWDYYIKSEDIKFQAGKNYTVSVDLKADKTSVVAIAAARADMFFTVGTEWTTCTFETGYLETEILNEEQKCITIGSGLVGTLSISNLVITETEGNDNLPTLSFFIEKAGIDTYLASNFTTKNIIEVEKAKDVETETKILGYKLTLNSTGVSLQLRDYAPVSENKLNRAIFNLKTDNSELTSAVVASVDNLPNDYVNYWNGASVIGENKDCEVCFPSYSEETSGLEQCAVEGIIKDKQTAGNTITITNFEISNVADLANTGKTFAISINDNFNYSDTLPFTQEVTVPAENSKEATFDVLLGNKVESGDSFNWDNVTRFLYQKTSDEFIDNSNVVKYVIAGDQNSPTYKLVNTSTESDVTCIITLTKDLKVEIKEKGDVGSQANPITDWETLSQLLMGNSTNEEVTLYVAGEFHVSSILQTCSPANIIPVGNVKFTRGKDVDDDDFSSFMFQHEDAMNLALGSEAGIITFSEDEVQTGSTFIDSSAESLTLTNCVFQNSFDDTEDIRISGSATAVYLNGTINIGNIFFSFSEVTPIYVGNLSADSLIGITLSEPENMLGKTILQPIEGNTVNLTNFKLLNDDYTITNDFKIAEVSTELTVNLQDENIGNIINNFINSVGTEGTVKVDGEISEGSTVMADICTAFKNGSQEARINLDLSGVTGLSEIPESAFEDCKNLVNITLPDCLVDIGDKAFLNCENLEYTEYSNGYYLGNADNLYLAFMSSKEATVTSIEINNATKIIAASAFAYCNELAKINIPNSVVTIGAQSFYNCFALTSITIPSSVTKIGVQAFYRITDNCDVSYPSVSFEDTNGWHCFVYDDNGEEKKTSFDVKDTDNFENYCYNDWFKDVQ